MTDQQLMIIRSISINCIVYTKHYPPFVIWWTQWVLIFKTNFSVQYLTEFFLYMFLTKLKNCVNAVLDKLDLIDKS